MKFQNKIIFLTSFIFGLGTLSYADTSPMILFAVPTTLITGWKLKNRIKDAYHVANEAHKAAGQKAKEAAAENQETQNDEKVLNLTPLKFILSKEFPRKATAITVAANALLWWLFYKDQSSIPERNKKREEEDRAREQKRAEDKEKYDIKQAELRAVEELRRAAREAEEQKRKEEREQREREKALKTAEESRVRNLKLDISEHSKTVFPAEYPYQSYGKRMSWIFAVWVAEGCSINNTFLREHFEQVWCMLEGPALKMMVTAGGRLGVYATAEQLKEYHDFGIKILNEQHATSEQIKYFERICQMLFVLQKDDVVDSARGAIQTRKDQLLKIIAARSKEGKFVLPRVDGDQVFIDVYDTEDAAHDALTVGS